MLRFLTGWPLRCSEVITAFNMICYESGKQIIIFFSLSDLLKSAYYKKGSKPCPRVQPKVQVKKNSQYIYVLFLITSSASCYILQQTALQIHMTISPVVECHGAWLDFHSNIPQDFLKWTILNSFCSSYWGLKQIKSVIDCHQRKSCLHSTTLQS